MSNCSLRYTGENCTIDNFTNVPLVILIGLYQLISISGYSIFIVMSIFGMIQKAKREHTQFFALSFVVLYILIAGSLSRVLSMLDPYDYFGVPKPVSLSVFWVGSTLIVCAAVLTYSIWLEVIISSGKISKRVITRFHAAKVVFLVAAVVLFSYYFLVMVVGVLVLDDLNLFLNLMYIVSLVFSFVLFLSDV
eukprot:TRINITY_DN2413_c0_g1_i1.p1 TRINITY_DN2413_c0_g1~~TRINITY_DN2413_c0_g1_i1.p1  ORF type:complete len:204 (+),score=11.19 TRINITY_DN2413_c0_g1_i1:39-614(+)